MSGRKNSISSWFSSFLSTDSQSADPVSVVISSTREKGSLYSRIWTKLASLAKSYGPTWLVLGVTLATINFWTVFLILTLWVSNSNSKLETDSSWFWSFLPSSITSTVSSSIQSFWGRFFITWALNRVTHPIRFWIALLLLKPLAPKLDPKLKAFYYKTHFKLKRFLASKRKTAPSKDHQNESEEDAWIEYQRQHINGGEADAELEIGFTSSTIKRAGFGFTPSDSPSTPAPYHPHPPSPVTLSSPPLSLSHSPPVLRKKEKSG